MDTQEIVRCTGCRLEHRVDHFETDRLGRRRKTCLSCKAKRKVVAERLKCEHRRERTKCKECCGSGICEHGRRRSRCKECGGSGICEHGRERSQCKECGGSGICEHKRMRAICKECDGGGICEHGRRRPRCKECGGSCICEHDRQRDSCKECGGSSICEHGRIRSRCKECGGGGICEHGRVRTACKACDPGGHLRSIVSCRVHIALKSDKSRGTLEYLGCSVQELKTHIEGQWVEGMTWENYGKGPGTWQIDHVIPIKYVGADGAAPTLEEVAHRLNWKNTQPLWTTDNIAKGNRYIGKPSAPNPPGA